MPAEMFGGVPTILAERRPRSIIGTTSDIELLNFLVIAGGDHWPKDGDWDWNASADLADHRTPLTPAFARQLSAMSDDEAAEPTVAFGAGALGSKVLSHLAREGSVALKIVDSARISPHNLVRHALGGRAIGLSKAEALKDELLKLYPGQGELPIESRTASALVCLRETDIFDGYSNLLDMTASNIVFNAVRDVLLPDAVRVHRAEIAHRGHLGLLSVEGADRNPRIDDLQLLAYDHAIDDDDTSAWLREVNTTRDGHIGAGGLEDIQIGISCSSATMRLSDDVVSFHAAAIARRLRPCLAKGGPSRPSGVIYRTFLGDEGEARASTQDVAPTTVVFTENGWGIRIAAVAADAMHALLRKRSPAETGGIMIGRIAATRRTIYVTRLVPAPPDSRGTAYGFLRGTKALPQALQHVHNRTGGLLTYVGEWHSHPMGGSDLSDTDKHAVISLRSVFDRVGAPTLVTVVTPDEIRPHLFEPTSPLMVVAPQAHRLPGFFRAAFRWSRW